jgi:hypothetical protein
MLNALLNKLKTVALLLLSGVAYAHEMTPTYPVFTPSYVTGVYKTQMQMFNRRADVEYYEIAVFDKQWKNIPFVSSYRMLKVSYLGHVTFDVFVREQDLPYAEYICSKSVLRRGNDTEPLVSSKICSKVKR